MKKIMKVHVFRFHIGCVLFIVSFVTVVLFLSPRHAIHNVRSHMCNGCFNRTFEFLTYHASLCLTDYGPVDTLILITSPPQGLLTRMALRETWLTHSAENSGKMRYAFLLGLSNYDAKIMKENQIYNDIILGNFIDSYKNLTLKTMMGLQWAVKYCRHAKYVMKSDDDVYINVPALLKTAEKYDVQLQSRVVGYCESNRHPIRNNLLQWHVSYQQYPDNTYPRYCLGGPGYLTSMDVVARIVKVSKNIPYFYIEDIYISICTSHLIPFVSHWKIKGFYAIDIFRNNHDPCIFKSDSVLAMHKIGIKTLRYIWTTPCKNDTISSIKK